MCPSRKGATEFAVDEENAPRTFFGTGYVKSGPYQVDDPMGTFDLNLEQLPQMESWLLPLMMTMHLFSRPLS